MVSMVTRSSLKGTGCSFYGDGLLALWGRAVRSWGRAVHFIGVGLFALVRLVTRSSIRRTSSDKQAWNKKIYLKRPKCEIFDVLFYRLINPIWATDLGVGKYFVDFEDGG
jgi:hypothetical protein